MKREKRKKIVIKIVKKYNNFTKDWELITKFLMPIGIIFLLSGIVLVIKNNGLCLLAFLFMSISFWVCCSKEGI